jgi:ubiquinone/menaquinone biosynthesis C-methylase UbiE
VVLSDFSPGMLRDARGGVGARHAVPLQICAYVAADAEAIPCVNASFDCVIANHMLYHVPEVGKAVAEIHRALRPEGRFCAATNGRRHLQELWRLTAEAGSRPDDLGPWSGMIGRFSLENGGEVISPRFPHVELHHYYDGMEVTEAEPLVAYVASMISGPPSAEALARFRKIVEARLAADGSVHIGKEAGLFEACKA